VTWSQLHTFVAVADTGSVRSAAARLSVTESAVSASLAGLQKSLGFALVERIGRGVRLTASGQVYAGYARRILGLIDEACSTAAACSAPERGTLRLGAVATAGEYLLPHLLASFHRSYPHVDVTLHVGFRDRVQELLLAHQLDVLIGGRPPRGHEFISRAQRANALIVVAAPNVPIDIASITWLLREEGSGTRDVTMELLRSLAVSPPTLTVGSHGAVVSSAMLGLGVGVVSQDAVVRQLTEGSLVTVAVRGTPLSRPWHAVTPTPASATAELFLRHVSHPRHGGDLGFTCGARDRSPPQPEARLSRVQGGR
jgi:DNA-binding transcriptional LysR family regulator